jgi:hypothetical protein
MPFRVFEFGSGIELRVSGKPEVLPGGLESTLGWNSRCGREAYGVQTEPQESLGIRVHRTGCRRDLND